MTDSFLSRWSRLKAESKATAEEIPLPAPAPPAPAREEAAPPAPDLPPVETMTKDSDFSAFLQAGVPEAIKRAALSKLWASDPLFSQPEVFDLHMEDYSYPSVPEVVKTAWRVGKGMVEEMDERETAPFPIEAEKTQEKTGGAEGEEPSS